MRASGAIRATAWALVAAGVAAPALRRRLALRPPAVLGASALAPAALCVAARPSRARDLAVCALNMWGYLAAYEMPHDDAERQAARVRVAYPARVDRLLGLGVPPTLRLQRRFARADEINRVERVLVWCHWVWFFVPHGSIAWVMIRRRERFGAAAARMYAVFDLGAVFYWLVPTAPPWWAAARGAFDEGRPAEVRRMMNEYGERFWGERWTALYDLLGGNPLAAMPSLHFATSLMAAHLLAEVGPVSAAAGWSYTGLLGLALVYLGEHYVVDLLAGAALTETVLRAAPALGGPARAVAGQLRTLHALGASPA